MVNPYEYSGKSLTPKMAQELIIELFEGKILHERDIIRKVDEVHVQRGGKLAQTKTHFLIKALKVLSGGRLAQTKTHPVIDALKALRRDYFADNPRRDYFADNPNPGDGIWIITGETYVIVNIPVSFNTPCQSGFESLKGYKTFDYKKYKELLGELSYDLERYGGSILGEVWNAGPDPAFDWISTPVLIPAKWTDNLEPQDAHESACLMLFPSFRLPNGRLVIVTMTMDTYQYRSVVYEDASKVYPVTNAQVKMQKNEPANSPNPSDGIRTIIDETADEGIGDGDDSTDEIQNYSRTNATSEAIERPFLENVSVSTMKEKSASRANPQQQEAIQTTEGPLLIIAGPGSGKTFTLVERIYYLISEKGLQPEQLFVSTFTEKAADELITRVGSRLSADNIEVNLNEMYIGTFHSICLRFLEENLEFTRLKRDFVLLDQFDQQYFLYKKLSEYQEIEGSEHIINGLGWRAAADLMKWVNKVSEEALDPEDLLNATEPEVQALGCYYQQYQKHLEEENYLDFSTIQVEALRLLEKHPDILDKIRAKIQYLMVDEYQDTNTIQERILFKLAEPDFNLCVVGDDDQGLYRFRGATIRNILEFPQKFPDGVCQQVQLTTNYRSHPDIIKFYNQWMKTRDWEIDGKMFRYEKEIVPDAKKDFVDMATVLKVSGDPIDENWHEEVLAFLRHLKDSGALTDWNQVAFLFWSVRNKKVVALAKALEAGGIPVYSPGSNQFFDRQEIRLMIGALMFLFPQFQEIREWREGAHLDIWNYYDKQCLPGFTNELRKPENEAMRMWCSDQAKEHLALTQGTDYAFSGLFYELLQFPMFSQYLGLGTQEDVIDGRPARNLATLSRMLDKYECIYRIKVLTPNNLDRSLQRLFNQFFGFLKEGAIAQYEDEYEDASEYAPSGCVSFMTIHQSKGLEFPVTIVGSMDADPWGQDTDLADLLQQKYYSKEPFEPLERTKYYDFWRLFYTAFSRAQSLLILTCQERTWGKWRAPSSSFKPVYDPVCSWRTSAFQPERLTLETIKDVTLKNEYSFTSHITVFEDCARQYKFYRDLGFAPIRRNQHAVFFGKLVHQTIEDIHKAVLCGEEHIVTEEQISDWFNANYTRLSRQEDLSLTYSKQKAALDQVLRYARRERGTWERLRETEVKMSLVKDAYLLKGQVDLIRGEDDTVEIVDFKSGQKPDLVSGWEPVERYRRQLEVYVHIIEGQTGQKISKMHLYYTGGDDGNPYVSFDKDARSIEKTMEAFDDIVARIENKDFEIDVRPERLCRKCDMQAYCDAM